MSVWIMFISFSVLYVGVDPEEIGVIAPDKAQVRTIREVLRQVNMSDILVGLVEQFQGQVCVDRVFKRDELTLTYQERKVIIMAATRSNEEEHPRRALGFLMNPRRMNGQQFRSPHASWLGRLMHALLGAITRAQSLLILVGDPGVLGKDMFWRTFLNYITLHNGSTGKLPGWKLTDEVSLPPVEVIPRGRVLFGEEFINGTSGNIYRFNLGEG